MFVEDLELLREYLRNARDAIERSDLFLYNEYSNLIRNLLTINIQRLKYIPL